MKNPANSTNKEMKKAAVLNQFGEVIGTCQSAGRSINFAGGFTRDGHPVNVTELKVSRSEKNLKKADRVERVFSHVFIGGIAFYS